MPEPYRRGFIAFLLAIPFHAMAQARRPAPNAAAAPAGIDLNSASQDELMALEGIGEVRARAIIRARPFKAKTELVERHIIPEVLYDEISNKVTVRSMPASPAPSAPASSPSPSQGQTAPRR